MTTSVTVYLRTYSKNVVVGENNYVQASTEDSKVISGITTDPVTTLAAIKADLEAYSFFTLTSGSHSYLFTRDQIVYIDVSGS